jgi:hypothetical protein
VKRILSFSLLVALAAPATPAVAAKARCANITGTPVMETTAVKVVERTYSGRITSRLFGCAKPNGLVRKITSTGTGSVETEMGSYELGTSAGTWISYEYTLVTAASTEQSTTLFNTRTGRSHSPFLASYENAGADFADALDALFFDTRGRAVTAVNGFRGADTSNRVEEIAVHAPDGTSFVVDSGTPQEIPPSSLAFGNGVATWMHGRATRSVVFE